MMQLDRPKYYALVQRLKSFRFSTSRIKENQSDEFNHLLRSNTILFEANRTSSGTHDSGYASMIDYSVHNESQIYRLIFLTQLHTFIAAFNLEMFDALEDYLKGQKDWKKVGSIVAANVIDYSLILESTATLASEKHFSLFVRTCSA